MCILWIWRYFLTSCQEKKKMFWVIERKRRWVEGGLVWVYSTFLCGGVLCRREKVKGFTLEASPVFICFFLIAQNQNCGIFLMRNA